MPKKKKNGLSPSRSTMHGREYGNGTESRSHRANRTAETQSRDEIIESMQEMFSHLDSEVIYMVLSEVDFKVDIAMDSLLELSDAAEGTAPPPRCISGFEQAAALLGVGQTHTEPHSETAQSIAYSNQPASLERGPDETHLTEEFDTLLDQELETFTLQQTQASSQTAMSSIPLSEMGKHKTTEKASISSPRLSKACGGCSPVNELSFGGVHIPEQKSISLDFGHLTGEFSGTEPRPSAFQVYRRPDQLRNHTKVSAVSQHNEALSTPTMFWNHQASEFHPHGVGPASITPVIPSPTPWNTNPISAAQWLAHRPIRQAPLKPSATVPKSWTLPPKNQLKLQGQVLVLLRGAPGSGKTTLAIEMLDQNPGGVVLSTDDYFIRNGHYHYEPNLLGEAHEWNQQKAKEAFEKDQTPIIIDNTNMQCWEMKPYVAMAQQHGYKVLFREPDTWWKTKPRELEKRTRHQVSKEKIRRILDRYDRFVSVQSIMNSQRPEPVQSVTDLPQTVIGHSHHPDLVGESGLSKLNAHLSSSLPDVSSVRKTFIPTSEEGEIGLFSSKETMACSENILESSELLQPDLLDGEQLDLELDACLVDSWTNEDFSVTTKEKFLEPPVAFSESIAQRIRRNLCQNDRNAQGVSAIDQTVNFKSSNLKNQSLRQDNEGGCEDKPLFEDNAVQPELLEFVGDWPIESQEQRRRQNSRNPSVKNMDMDSRAVDKRDDVSSDEGKQSGAKTLNEVEFQKLVDLLQKGGNSSLGLHASTPRERTSQHSQLLGAKGTMAWSELPDCVQKLSEPNNPSKDSIEEQAKKSNKMSVEKSTAMHAQKQFEKEETVASEEKSRLSPSIQESQSSRGGIESESSLERRKGLSRRIGKSCKLALTFTNQSPSSPSSQSPVVSHMPPDLTPSEVMPSLHMVSCFIASTQTYPQDFALLWRIDQQKCFAVASKCSCSAVILEGSSFRFTPKTNEEQSACQQGVPYCVVHEKSSQVEENDFIESHSKQYNLEILSRHFRHVTMDILEDLYEKCHQDMEWTTNLLLDSGEQLYKEDDEEAYVKSFVTAKEFDYNQEEKKVPSIQFLETVRGSDVDQVRAACSDEQNVTDSNDSSASSISPKPQETNLSDLSQAVDDWSTGQSEAEGFPRGVHIIKEKCETSIIEEPTENTNTQLEVPAANKEEQDNTDQQGPGLEQTLVRQSEQIFQDLEGSLGRWSEEGGGKKEKEETKADVDAVTQLLLHKIDEMEHREEEERKEREKEKKDGQERRKPGAMDIKTLELKLPTELALQLIELFGPVGVSPGAFSADDCSVQIDMNMAKLLHHKWKETIQEKHRQAALSYQLLPESLFEEVPFMDHWNVPCPYVSLRDIMIEEQVMQDSMERFRSGRRALDKKDSAAKLKENQLFSMFPTIDQHFLQDIFRDHNYSLEQTEQFLHALLDDRPVKNVVASETAPQHNGRNRALSKERKWKLRDLGAKTAQFQDTEDPEYEDFRTEAVLHRRQQIESFNKAAEAYRQGRKEVASFYAQQGRIYGEKMREANHRAAMQIFKRVNASLLPQNILDLHGLHVDEAIHHLDQVLADKTLEWNQGLCGPQLSVITGKGNHSQGGVARIRPAVLDYLKSHHYSYTEPKTGLLLVTLH